MKSTHHIRNRMRWLILSLGMMWTMLASAQSNINKIEYFFDTDPGFGSGTNVTVSTPAVNISALNFSATLPANAGFHTFYVRSRNANGAWSLTNSSFLIKYQAQATSLGTATNINKLEYFFDTDPGFGLGINVPVTSATNISNLSVPISINSLNAGFHMVYIRSRDSLGRWSMTNNSNFLKYQAQPFSLGAVVPVNKIEYFFDTDPGFGLGTNVPVTASTDINGLAIPVSLASINGGFHMLYIRSRDSLGRWSITNNSAFIKYASQTSALGPVVNINKMEYFIDTDPGFGLGTNVPVTSATDINGLAVSVNLASINPGFHTLYIRSRDSLGRWSITNNSIFIKYQNQTASLGPLVKIMKLEYFIDIDPGVGHATNVAITPTLNLSGYVFAANLSTVSNGAHKLYVRSIDSLGRWSITNYGSFNGGTLQPPTATITVVGTQPLCAGTGYLKVNADASPIATYQWKLGTTNVGTNDTIFYPTSSGSYTVVVTNTAGTATSSPVSVTVNPAPTATISAGGPLAFCQGGSVALSVNQTANASYQWKIGGSNIGGATTSTYSATSSGVYNVVVTGTNGCSTPSAKDTVVVTPSVTPTISITANQVSICTGTLDSFFATITNGGTNPTYTWKKNGVTVGSNSPVYVNSSLVNNDTIYCILTSNAVCATPSVLTSNKIIMIVSSVSAPSVSISPLLPTICSGAIVTFTATPVNGGSNPTYQWYQNGVLQAGSTGTFATAAVSNNDSIWCIMTSNSVCASVPTATSTHAKVTVNPTVTPSVSVVASQLIVCASGLDTFTATPTNGGASPFYQWYRNGVLQTGNASTFITSLANNDSVWCVMTSGAACPSPSTATSNHVHISVTSTVVPTITIAASQTTICAGDSVTFTASITNGGANPVYQWKKNNVNVGSNSPIYGNHALVNNDSVWCVLTSSATCASPASVTSAHIKITVNQVTAPTNTVTASQNNICSGTSITFTSIPVNGGTNPTYQWYQNGVIQASVTNTFSTSALSNNDSVWCVITSNSPCASVPTATSNKIVVIVSPTVTPSVSVSASFLTICTAASDTFRATPINGGNAPSYQWYRNGVLQAGNTATYITTSLTNNDSVWCVMTSNAACPSPSTAISNHVHMTVNSYVTPTIAVTASPSSICAGDSVTLTAVITNGGANPVYQWKKNGINVGNSSAIYGTRTVASTDSFWCVLTSNAPCPTVATVTSNKVHVIVNAIVTPTITVSASQSTICAGTNVTFTANITNGGANPSYAWYKNGALVSVGTSTYSDNGLLNNDSVWCILTSGNACASPASVSSTHTIITITTAVVPSVSVTASQTTICAGTSVTFTANPTNGGTSPSYQWYKNGVLQAGNTATFTPVSVSNNDSVWCIMTSNASCVSPATATSVHVHMTVNPIVVPTISISATPTTICVGDSVTFTASITNGGANPSYHWKKNGANVGTGSAIYGIRNLASTDSVWCVLTSTATCASPASVNSNHIHITVNPIVAPTITVSATQTTICVGTTVTFTANITNGGANPSYVWYQNGVIQASSTNTFATSALSNNDSVWCVLTSSNACASPASATSAHIIITITTAVVPSVSVTASQTTVCAGTSVTFTAHPTNGGSSPSYQWYKNGVLQAGNAVTFTPASVSNNDSVWCIMTSNASCVSPATATSAHVLMTVNPILTPTIVISATPTTICAGDSVTFTAVITNGGANPTYQWKKNGANVGTGTAIYGVRNLVSTDSVWCVLTSTATCATPVSVNSNHIHINVNPVVAPTITVSATQTTICVGTTVTFTANITNGGANPSYVWYQNGVIQPSNTNTFATSALSNNDSVWCVLTSSNACASPASVTSAHIIITITTAVVPSVSVTASQTTVCAGTSVTFTASPTNGGSSPSYQWYKNGVLQAGNAATFTPVSVSNNDSLWCIMTSNASCVSPATATSAHILITVTPIVIPTIFVQASPTTICAGDSVTFTAGIGNGGANPTYQWIRNGISVGSNSPTYGTTTLASTDSIWCILTSTATCASPVSVTSSKVRVTINPIVTPTISVTASQTTICAGSVVTFTASATNTGANPIYQWYKDGTAVGVNAITYTDSTLANNDSVWCVLTSTATCASTNTATSTHVVMTLTGTVVPSIFVSTPSTTVCQGSAVTFTANPTNGGTTPLVQWYRNGVLQVTTGLTYSISNLTTADSVWCILTSSVTCASPTTATSAVVHMSITQPSYYGYSASICPGATYVFNGTSLTQAGTYTDTLTSVSTCDSIITLTLSIYAQPLQTITASICPGDSFDFRGVEIHQAGSYADTLIGAGQYGCDSIIQLSLSIRPIRTGVQFDTVCHGASYTFNGQVYSASGTYADTLTGSNGCDSIAILYLTVSPLVTTSFSDYTCAGYPYNFHGHILTGAGTYTDTLTSHRGCDSIVYLTLTVRTNSGRTIKDTICQGSGFVFHGVSLTQSGTYRDTLTSANGCDSVITLSLTVNPKPAPVVTLQGAGALHTTVAFTSYQWLRNNIVITGATSQAYTATQNGTYSVIVTNAFGCSDTSVGVSVTHIGIIDVAIANLHIYPNPAETTLHIEADGIHPNTTLQLVDAIGRTVYEQAITGESINDAIDVSSYASGMYVLILKDSEKVYVSYRVVKK